MNLSVVICSYNRSSSLLNTLISIAKSTVSGNLKWEVLVVDNNSSDGTEPAVMDFIGRDNPEFKYIFEPRQGKSYALNTGISHAAGEIVAFTDDDALVAPDWLSSIVREFESDPSLSGVGGRVLLHNINDKPIATRTSQERMLLSRDTFDSQCIQIIGCNMAFVSHVFEKVGMFDSSLGPGSTLQAVCEDMDFIYRVCRAGLKIFYSPDVLVYHNHGRRTDADVESSRRGYRTGRGAFYCKHILAGDLTVFKMAFREVIHDTLLKRIKAFLGGDSYTGHRDHLRGLTGGALSYYRFSRRNRTLDFQ